MTYAYTPKEDARLVIRHRAREVVALAKVTAAMGEIDEANRLVVVAGWLERAADMLANEEEDAN